MADVSATFQTTLTQGNDVVQKTVTLTGDAKDYFTPTVPAADNVDVIIGLDPDNVKAYAILSDQDVTLTTTNSTGSADVLSVVANKPLNWHVDMQLAKHFVNANPWTSWNLACAGATAAEVKILILRDSTP